ncbi:hypothetical protein [Cellulomonas sp. ATA003]|uniref:hypothetical protein n=1 Tax=Cellulomonas sp. ATA003 TaxID=3073064 RepID=UPI00287396BE|nr:hypothetical protein [Cellulomonas sp. ATA003]WNB86550.1 hypothetical protein REH70_04775 [Cellulomonas sp. ATA003]
MGSLTDVAAAFRTVQAAEAWRAHGDWVTAHPGALGSDVAARFAWAATVSSEQERDGRTVLRVARDRLDDVLRDRVLLLPSAAGPAPSATADPAALEAARAATLALTCLAGVLGAPAVSVPVLRVADGPVGLCLVGPRGRDLALLDLALIDLALAACPDHPGGRP